MRQRIEVYLDLLKLLSQEIHSMKIYVNGFSKILAQTIFSVCYMDCRIDFEKITFGFRFLVKQVNVFVSELYQVHILTLI